MTGGIQQIAFSGAILAEKAQVADKAERFAALVSKHSSFVFRIAFTILRNVHDSEDALQETFFRLYRGGAWERIKDERAFLARMTWRIAVDMLPRKRHGDTDRDLASDAIGAEESMIVSEKHTAVHRLMDSLPEELRQPLALSTVEELSSRQIAQMMGIPEGTVRTRISRARQLLRQKVAESYGQ
jgi:RNA polymerase sigma-70 factor (ECF subfamily)